jgi:hypothetical protein
LETAFASAAHKLDTGTQRVVILTQSGLSHHWSRKVRETRPQDGVFVATGAMGNRWRTYMTTPCRWIVVS